MDDHSEDLCGHGRPARWSDDINGAGWVHPDDMTGCNRPPGSGESNYRLVRRPADGMAVIIHPSGDMAVWARRKMRKSRTCPISGQRLAPGDLAYGPIGNQMYRAERIRADIIDDMSSSEGKGNTDGQ